MARIIRRFALKGLGDFFECVDNCDGYSYLIYKNNIEIRRVLQEEDEDVYFEGEIQGFEKEWLNFSIYYEREYSENGKLKTEKITDYDFSPECTEDTESYFKHYHIASKNQSVIPHWRADCWLNYSKAI